MADTSRDFDSPWLADKGLNLQAAFDLSTLPDDIVQGLADHCQDPGAYRQLLLIGHGGRQLWQGVQQAGSNTDNPVDDYTVAKMEEFLGRECPGAQCTFLYPGPAPIGLRALGALAGWHHASPFRVGIHAHWGTWFAYRAVVLTTTDFKPTVVPDQPSPCDDCDAKPCIPVCPAKAVAGDELDLDKCLDYRLGEKTFCADKCLSRLACPVGAEHRYSKDQMGYHYGRSLQVVRAWDRTGRSIS